MTAVRLPDTLNSDWFRVLCAVGHATRKHLPDVFIVADELDGRGWQGVLDLIEQQCVLALRTVGALSKSSAYVEFAKRELESLAPTFKEENKGIKEILLRISDDLTHLDNGKLYEQISVLSGFGLAHAKKCVLDWGGTTARQRIHRLRPLEIRIDDPEDDSSQLPAHTHFDPNSNKLVLVIGESPKPLISYLSLDFYFFHEYLSHVFPTWDDPTGILSEGYLMALAKWSFLASCESPIFPMLVQQDMGAHRARYNYLAGSDYWRNAEFRADWFRSRCHDGTIFARFLLELAASEEAEGTEDMFLQRRLMAILDLLWRSQRPEMLADALVHLNDGLGRVHDHLRANVKPLYQKRLTQ